MHATDILLIVLGLAAGAATLVGGALALRFASKIHLILGLSAGAVLGVAFFDLLPEALSLAGRAGAAATIPAAAAAGFIFYLVLDRALLIASSHEAGHRGHLGAGTLTVHSFIDGLGIGLGFQVSASVGAVMAIAVLAHDFADGVNTVNLSLAGENRPRTARLWLAADAIAPLAGIGASRLVSPAPGVLAILIAVFAGLFLYVGASELLPESHHRHPRAWTTVATLIGLGLLWLVVRLAP
ncbi:MAG TPA: ZIP family metal transporter [Caulobacteraceae bacterium]|nr:ZIP family metal transporter [Caulobacteraceae bacterium]